MAGSGHDAGNGGAAESGLFERWFNLASVYERTGQPAKAREACARALLLDPNFEMARHLQTEIESELK